MKQVAIIVAGGTGSRMHSKIPKQFMLLQGKPVLMHTLERFHSYHEDMQLILVINELYSGFWENLCREHAFAVTHRVVKGGAERFHSVKNGLEAIGEKEAIVAVHDAVRPLVSHRTIHQSIQSARKRGNGVPFLPVTDSLRYVEDGASRVLDREKVKIIQTPQVFQLCLLKEAYHQEYSPQFTDDASLVEKNGHRIHLVEGNRENIKITTRQDLMMAESLLSDSTRSRPVGVAGKTSES